MNLLVTMPRETNTSLFTSHVSQMLLIAVCVIGLILVGFVFVQNYRNWSARVKKEYESDTEAKMAKQAAKKDFFSSIFVLIVCSVFFISLIIRMGLRLFL